MSIETTTTSIYELDMTTSQTYEYYIKLKSIFELDPPPTSDELEKSGGVESLKLQDMNHSLSMLLFRRGNKEHSPRAKDMLKASAYFLSLLDPDDQKDTKRTQFTMSIHQAF